MGYIIMLYKFGKSYPSIGKNVFIAPSADLIGDVRLKSNSSIFFGSVLRADINYIYVGENTNLQDLCCCHVGDDNPCIVGDNCVIGHRVTLHGCLVKDRVLVGMGAVILNSAEIGEGSIICAGTLVTQNAKIPPRSMVRGIPGKIVRGVTIEEYKTIIHFARKYVMVKDSYLEQNI